MHRIPLLLQAKAVNPALQLMGSAWSAPAWMKTTESLYRGTLKPEYVDDYAAYLARFVDAWAARGLPLSTLTLGNEPQHKPADYPGMWLTPSDEIALVNQLGPALAGKGVKILTLDHNWALAHYGADVLRDTHARQYVDGTAFHCYGGAPDYQTIVRDAHPDKEIHFTECSSGNWATNWADNLVWDGVNLLVGATRNWAQTILKWNLALDTSHGPHTGGCGGCTGLVTIDPGNGSVSYNHDYYALGHVSKFVVPGAQRIASTARAGTDLHSVAFRNPDGSKVLVVVNAGGQGRSFLVRWGGQAFQYSLDKQSIATFRWNGTQGAPAAPAAPTALSAAAADSKVSLKWEFSALAASYDVRRSASGGAWTTVATGVALPEYVDRDVVNGTGYAYAVRAVNAVGGSADSPPATATPGPPPLRSAGAQLEAESFDTQSGIGIEPCSDATGCGQSVGYTENGDYLAWNQVHFGDGATNVALRVASGSEGGTIELRLGSPTGTLIGSVPVANTGGWGSWTTRTAADLGRERHPEPLRRLQGPSAGDGGGRDRQPQLDLVHRRRRTARSGRPAPADRLVRDRVSVRRRHLERPRRQSGHALDERPGTVERALVPCRPRLGAVVRPRQARLRHRWRLSARAPGRGLGRRRELDAGRHRRGQRPVRRGPVRGADGPLRQARPDGKRRQLVVDPRARALRSVRAAPAAASSPPPPDTTAPVITLNGPASGTQSTTATFTFSANETATFRCRLDAAGFAACASGISYSGLQPGQHVFQVEATDAAGNVGAASHTWTIAAPPPPPPPPPPVLDTGFLGPLASSADTGGDGNGFQTNPSGAHADDAAFAVDTDSGSGSSTSCTSSSKDRHRFRDYGIALPGSASIKGIEVRLDARADSRSGSPKMCVQLSWNGGVSWTSAKTTSTLTTSVATHVLGGATNTWGRTWSAANLDNANFRLRVINISSSSSRDFSLDWVAVKASYTALAADGDRGDARLRERRLRRRQPGERDAVGRARDVVEPEPVAEGDRARLAAVLPADPELDPGLRPPAALDRDPHEIPHSVLVQHLERVPLEDAVLEVEGEELALGVVAGEPERGLGEVVRAEGEEVGLLRDLVRAQRRPRELDHRPTQVRDRRLLGGDALGQLAEPRELLPEADERVHDLDEGRLARPLRDGPRGAHDRAHLHLVDLRELEAEPAAARPQHRVRLVQLADAVAHRVRGRLLERRQELVQRRVEEADGDGQPRHRLEDPLEVGLLHGRSRSSAARRSSSSRARIMSRTIGRRSSAMNMCSVRQRPMPSAPNSRAFAASSGVSAFARTFSRR